MNIFSIDGPLLSKLDRFTDLVGLALITTVCCIPVVTIGASLTAMYSVTMRMAKNEDGKIIKPFFKAFAANFKQSTVVWLFCMLLITVFYGDYYILYQSGLKFSMLANRVVTIASGGLLLLSLFAATYVFPLLAYFDNTIKNTIKNALIMSIFRFKQTLLLIIINLLPMLVGFVYPILWPVALVAEFAASSYIASRLYVEIFKYYSDLKENDKPSAECNKGSEATLIESNEPEEKPV